MEHDNFFLKAEEDRHPEEERFLGCRCQISERKMVEVGGRIAAVREVLPQCGAAAPLPLCHSHCSAALLFGRPAAVTRPSLDCTSPMRRVRPIRTRFPMIAYAPFFNLTLPAKDLHESAWRVRGGG